MNVIDKLIENTIRTKNPSVIGLDPDVGKIPACYKVNAKSNVNSLGEFVFTLINILWHL